MKGSAAGALTSSQLASADAGEKVTVGVNKYVEAETAEVPLQRLNEAAVTAQVDRLADFRRRRDAAQAAAALDRVRQAAQGSDNLLPVLRAALLADCTLGELCFALRDVWGEYIAPQVV